ncbi:hypothetical protein ACFW9F_18165, partial [Streptomyces sp. NPDC059506]|uniref:hypothetical protein n=1 Tax=Streptomyces sp. NPDC059506 TaxID=3347751 RepID=UPI00369E4A5D
MGQHRDAEAGQRSGRSSDRDRGDGRRHRHQQPALRRTAPGGGGAGAGGAVWVLESTVIAMRIGPPSSWS